MHAATIGPYALDAPLGQGGMGVVWAGTLIETGAPVTTWAKEALPRGVDDRTAAAVPRTLLGAFPQPRHTARFAKFPVESQWAQFQSGSRGPNLASRDFRLSPLSVD